MVDNSISLTAVRHLPDVVRLVRILSDKFHSVFSREDASDLSLSDFCERNKEIENLDELVDSFIDSWNCMMESSCK